MFDLQNFFTSIMGQLTTTVIILSGLILASALSKSDTQTFSKVKILTLSAIFVALSTVLNFIVLFKAPQGGSVTLAAMLPIVLAGYFFNAHIGIVVGICVGLINLLLNPYVIHPVQMLLDYPLAFGSIGFGALFFRNSKYHLIISTWIGISFRFVCAFLSGVIFFASFAPDNLGPVLYSFVYNISYLALDGAIISIILSIPAVRNVFEKLKKQC